MNFEEWVKHNKGYDYYIKTLRALDDCNVVLRAEGEDAWVYYKNYCIMKLRFFDKKIYISHIPLNKKELNYKGVVQDKLIHEVNEYFNLYINKEYTISYANSCIVTEYLKVVFNKIDNGFEKYLKLVYEQGGTVKNDAYLKVKINNAFSLANLYELLSAYNELYSVLFGISEKGIENIDSDNIASIKKQHNLILESIHIASEGAFVSLGSGLIIELIKTIISVIRNGDLQELRLKKAELERQANQSFLEEREMIFRLIQLLDRYDNMVSSNSRFTPYIMEEIQTIVRKIEELQGTKHIDILG